MITSPRRKDGKFWTLDAQIKCIKSVTNIYVMLVIDTSSVLKYKGFWTDVTHPNTMNLVKKPVQIHSNMICRIHPKSLILQDGGVLTLSVQKKRNIPSIQLKIKKTKMPFIIEKREYLLHPFKKNIPSIQLKIKKTKIPFIIEKKVVMVLRR